MTVLNSVFTGLVALALLAGPSAPAGAQGAQPPPALTRQIVPVPFNEAPATQVSVSLNPKEPRVGGMASICFGVSRPGFLTLWNVATNGSVTRVFPNSFQPAAARDQASMRVEATRAACVGAGPDSFRFRVDGPPGIEDLYLLWSARPELQPQGGSFTDATSFASALRRLEQAGAADWATAKTSFDIVPPAGPVPPPLPAPQGSGAVERPSEPSQQAHPGQQAQQAQPPGPAQPRGRVLILSMGANVDKLVKPNQDATLFAQVVGQSFRVAPEDSRLIMNATKADFRGGMEWLRSRAGPNDVVFLYFSGHGGQVDDPTRTSDDGMDEVLIPYDFEINRPVGLRDAVFSQELARWINALPTANVISVLDTCHSGGLYRSIEADVLGARSKAYRLPADADLTRPDDMAPAPATRAASGRGRIKANGLLMAAARRDQSALEGPQGSYFTMALLRELRTASDGTLADTFDRAADQTRTQTRNRQTPVTVGTLETARLITFSR